MFCLQRGTLDVGVLCFTWRGILRYMQGLYEVQVDRKGCIGHLGILLDWLGFGVFRLGLAAYGLSMCGVCTCWGEIVWVQE